MAGQASYGIALSDVRAIFTKTLIDVYQQRIYPTDFLSAFFPSEVALTKEISIQVERMGEKVALDIIRGSEGNRNEFAKSTEKIFLPPLYKEYMDMTELDLYDRVLGSQGDAQIPLFEALILDAATRLGDLTDKIRRAKELQCSQVLETGVVNFKNQLSVDYKRKAASLVDLSAPPSGYSSGYWSTNSDLFNQLEQACLFLRQVGRSGDGMFIAICGSQALHDLLANTVFTTRQNLFSMALDAVHGPVRAGNGATYHGTLTCGSFKVALWAYPQFYDDPNNSNASTAYVNSKKVILIPEKPRFKMAHAAVPRLIGRPGQMPAQGEFVTQEMIDDYNAKHILNVQSAAIAVPSAVDQMVTLKVCA